MEAGTVRYREAGQGTPLVFVHGALVNSQLWDGAAELLTDRFRCILPDLPLGSHRAPMEAGADISPVGIAPDRRQGERELGAEDAILVGNDSGGASLCSCWSHPSPTGLRGAGADQHATCTTTSRPGSSARCSASRPGTRHGALADHADDAAAGEPPLAAGLSARSRSTGSPTSCSSAGSGRASSPPRSGATSGRCSGRRPGADRRGGREDARVRHARCCSPGRTEDKLFKIEYAERLAATLPDARVVRIPDARTFVMLDQPQAAGGRDREVRGGHPDGGG